MPIKLSCTKIESRKATKYFHSLIGEVAKVTRVRSNRNLDVGATVVTARYFIPRETSYPKTFKLLTTVRPHNFHSMASQTSLWIRSLTAKLAIIGGEV